MAKLQQPTTDKVVSNIIRYMEYTYNDPCMVGLAMRLRSRLAEFRETGRWFSLMGEKEPKLRPAAKGEPGA